MIIAKSPLRMSFVGGGSDIHSYYKESIGAVLSTTIDKYIYVGINKKFDDKVRFSYSKTELVDICSDLQHPIAREAFKIFNVNGGIELFSVADIHSEGSGLGSSSSFTVALLGAIAKFKDIELSREELASLACEIEIEKCCEPIGKQDQYAAAFGGMNLIEFLPDGNVKVEKMKCSNILLEEFERNLIILYTGISRKASTILTEQRNSLDSVKRSLMRRMVDLVYELNSQLVSGSLENVGKILDENWRLKVQMANGIENKYISEIYEIAKKNGAEGGKILGAGGGGFMMLYAPKKAHKNIIMSLQKLQRVYFRFESNGVKISEL